MLLHCASVNMLVLFVALICLSVSVCVTAAVTDLV